MEGSGKLKVYRVPTAQIVPVSVAVALFFFIGLSMILDPRESGGISGIVVGVMAVGLSLWMGAVLATSRVIVTQTGLVCWSNLRRSYVSWAEVGSFGVAPGRYRMRWPTLVINLNDGAVVFTSIAAYRNRYPARIADEMAAWRQQLTPAVPTGGDLLQGEQPNSVSPS